MSRRLGRVAVIRCPFTIVGRVEKGEVVGLVAIGGAVGFCGLGLKPTFFVLAFCVWAFLAYVCEVYWV